MATQRQKAISVLEADPELTEGLDPHAIATARSHAIAPVLNLRPGEWKPQRLPSPTARHLGLLVVDGMLARHVTLMGRASVELFGEEDLLRPWDDDTEQPQVPRDVNWTVLQPTRLAVLDDRFAERIAPWPEISAALIRRTLRRARWLAFYLAILENPRVDIRLLLLFWHLADRWGHVGSKGIVLPLRLTHQMLGRLVRAQRPSVTASLSRLSQLGVIRRDGNGPWILHGGASQQLRRLEAL